MRWYYWTGLIAVVAVVAGYFYVQSHLSAPLMGDAQIAQMKEDIEAEDESAFVIPPPQPAEYPAPNPLNNVYFGELHVHSSLSIDSYIFGNRLNPDQSYRFAKGQPVTSPIGGQMQLTVPLDFAAVTDHAEGFGQQRQCDDPESGEGIRWLCEQMENPSLSLFLQLREAAAQRPPAQPVETSAQEDEKAILFAQEAWAEIVAVADAHNDPGRFTTFAAYEYSPPLPGRGKIHRNVIFRGNDVPGSAVSAYDAPSEIDLWEKLNAGCQTPCEFLTIPHNPNKTWGLAFANHTIDGDAYTEADWRVRGSVEPLVEMYQIKGNSECSIGFSTTDEECNFEQFLPRCEEGQTVGCISPTSMARDGLKIGLELEDTIGINPLKFGLIGATDTHNSNPGDTEEWDYRGPAGVGSATAKRRLSPGPDGSYPNLMNNPGGLAAIWAPQNTRDALFDAMQRKEVYATSGTRIRLRFFASFDFEDRMADRPDVLETAYRDGATMGGELEGVSRGAPKFLIWAMQDPLSAPLDRIQIIKGWTEDGETFEVVHDVACSEGRAIDPETKRCVATAASVDLSNCEFDEDRGAAELKILWTDPDYHSSQNAFYYARVIQNPTCRWSTYDSLRIGQDPPDNVPPTITEMAWSSPIWLRRD
jgi:hypothetical protein